MSTAESRTHIHTHIHTYMHTYIHMYIHASTGKRNSSLYIHTYMHVDGQGLFVRPPYIHNATWASLGFSGPLWASLSLSQPAREPPAKRMTGLFYPRSGPLGLSGHLWASLGLSHRGSPRGLPLGFHTEICGEPAWSSPAKRMTGFFLSTLHLSGLLWASSLPFWFEISHKP